MKTKREVAVGQIELQREIQSHGINIVTCCNCGSTLIYKQAEQKVDCFCGKHINTNDCEDLWYEGIENSLEFNQ